MRSFLRWLVVLVVAGTSMQAQLVITRQNFQFSAGSFPTNILEIPALEKMPLGDAQQWDIDPVQNFPNTGSLQYLPNTIFPQIPNSMLRATFENLNPNSGYELYELYQISDNGVAELGALIPEQRYGLGMLTGNATDSLIIPEGAALSTNPRMILPFPATSKTAFSSSYRRVTNGEITVSLFGLDKTPISKVVNITQHDSIVAWGKLRIPTGEGKTSAFMDVLVSKRSQMFVDSILLNGQPAPAPFLAAMGISQGATERIHRYIFWRANFIPVLSMNFGEDTSFSKSATVIFDASIEGVVNSVENDAVANATIYPNPATSQITLPFMPTTMQSTISIVNALGVEVASVPVFSTELSAMNVPISVASLSNGVYQAVVRSADMSILSRGEFVIAR